MNQEDPRSDLWTFVVGSPNRIQLPSLSNINDSRHISQTSTISKKNTLHLTNIHDLKKKYPTPVKHSWSQKNTLHLTNIRDPREKIPYTRDLNLFHVKNSHVKTGKKYVSHLSKVAQNPQLLCYWPAPAAAEGEYMYCSLHRTLNADFPPP